jgi:methylenetetrahydrofolate reductase (NADPH)
MDAEHLAISHLEQVLRSGRFAVTAELNTPDSADPQDVYRAAEQLSGVCDAINVADSSGANAHMSGMTTSALLVRSGYEPVFQITCRDRNRIALQGDLLGAAALGIRNILCLTGDDVTVGDQPQAKRVFDFDSIQLLRTASIMRDHGKFLSGRTIQVPPRLFLGAASNPFAPPSAWRPQRLAKKIEAGADFIQTQYCFDLPVLRAFMRRVRELGLHERVFILVGVGPLTSLKTAKFMQTRVPGVFIPDSIIDRLRGASQKHQYDEGRRILLETIEQIREIEGIAGIHLMAYRHEHLVAEIIEEAGLLPRPKALQSRASQGSDEPG